MSIRNRKRKLPGLPPGTPIHTGKYMEEEVTITIIDYSPDVFKETLNATPEECKPPGEKDIVRWIHVSGVHKPEVIESISTNFDIHPLIVEDFVNTKQRPKIEIYDDSVYMVARFLHVVDDEEDILESEQISLFVSSNYVISYQESPANLFEPVKERLKQEKSRIRGQKTDYLTYSLLDIVIDNYFVVLEYLSDLIEDLEDLIIETPKQLTLNSMYRLKRSILYCRRHIWPLREVVSRFNRDEIGLIKPGTIIFLGDLYDHIIRATDIVETYRDSLTSVLDIYLSSLSNRMNEIMQLLAAISTIFIPLTLMASIYGMNFIYMPETQWEYGYPVLLTIMISISLVLAYYFKRKGWL